MKPLADLLVLDFSTLLPGPLAGLILAEAGAQVLKIERPGLGDEMRTYEPKLGRDSANFALLNRGKGSLAIDLKSEGAIERLTPLLRRADVLIEQFRPGVMARLGLGYEVLAALNPRLIYCSITGWGQTGPLAQVAAHDLNYMAETGVLGLSRASDDAPPLPPILAADIAGGAYPAVMNILLALRERELTGRGRRLDIAMADNLFTLQYWALANHAADGRVPEPGGELVTGGSPRYAIYRTADGRHLAAAPLEERFWSRFCELIDLPEELRLSTAPQAAVRAAVAERIGRRTAGAWRDTLDGEDVCCNVVATLDEALAHPHFRARGLFDRSVDAGGRLAPALPLPLDSAYTREPALRASPSLGDFPLPEPHP